MFLKYPIICLHVYGYFNKSLTPKKMNYPMKKHNFFIKRKQEGKWPSMGNHNYARISDRKFVAIQTKVEINYSRRWYWWWVARIFLRRQQSLCPCSSKYLWIPKIRKEELLNYQPLVLENNLSTLKFSSCCLAWKLLLSWCCSICCLRWMSRWINIFKRWFCSTCWNLVAYSCSIFMSFFHFSELPPAFLMYVCTWNFISIFIIYVITWNGFVFFLTWHPRLVEPFDCSYQSNLQFEPFFNTCKKLIINVKKECQTEMSKQHKLGKYVIYMNKIIESNVK